MISNTCVAPPVGSGKAETPSRRMKISAKLFSSKTPIRPPSVLSPSPASHSASSSLTLSGAGRGSRRIVLGEGGRGWQQPQPTADGCLHSVGARLMDLELDSVHRGINQ